LEKFFSFFTKVDIGFPQTPDNPATLQTNLTIEGPSALIEDAWFKALPGSRDEMGVMVEVEVFARLHNPLLFNVSVDTFDSDFFLMAPDNPQCNTTVSSRMKNKNVAGNALINT